MEELAGKEHRSSSAKVILDLLIWLPGTHYGQKQQVPGAGRAAWVVLINIEAITCIDVILVIPYSTKI